MVFPPSKELLFSSSELELGAHRRARGVVINRPLHKKIKDMNPTNHDLATYFANCHLHFGGPLHKKIKDMNPTNYDLATYFANCHLHFDGPLEANIFLLKKSSVGKPLCPKCPAFEDVVPGLSFGAINSLEEAAAMVRKGQLKPQDFRFFMGYAGWQFDQLKEEIESNYWYVAACSLDLIGWEFLKLFFRFLGGDLAANGRSLL
ncbi:hypothetical protein SAY87_020825 [Trapa incisa]|uniref:Uncharacterized protein n=1 Tax=Trapa incisa TaxID=236973 RepID=A0AAN7PNC8_9MYRT|nr:hypothetical protein SAY87_020825 [Trapa incisa]